VVKETTGPAHAGPLFVELCLANVLYVLYLLEKGVVMRSFPSTDITRKSGQILDQADRGPVSITRYNRPRYVVMSVEYYERLTHLNPRTVHTLDNVDPDMQQEMLDAIDKELSRE
jgi:prevent-host-death family protein